MHIKTPSKPQIYKKNHKNSLNIPKDLIDRKSPFTSARCRYRSFPICQNYSHQLHDISNMKIEQITIVVCIVTFQTKTVCASYTEH